MRDGGDGDQENGDVENPKDEWLKHHLGEHPEIQKRVDAKLARGGK